MTQPGWLCTCGHWQDDDFHCELCGEQPSWGCDCGDCADYRHGEDIVPYDDDEIFYDDEEDYDDDEEREDE